MILKTFPPGAFYNTYTDVHTLYIKCARDKLYKNCLRIYENKCKSNEVFNTVFFSTP